MEATRTLWETLKRHRLIALLAPDSPATCVTVYETLQPLGVILEIALRTPAALEGITAIRDRHPEALLLAGTVLTRHQVEDAIAAGAAGIVSPDYFPAVVEACVARDIMCIPGGLTDAGKQLAQKAELYGCSLDELRAQHHYQWVYKLFPAVIPGGGLLDAVPAWKAVYPGLTFVYTGGVSADNLRDILRRDPEAVVCGSALARHAGDAAKLGAEAQRWLAAIRGTPSAATRPAATTGTTHAQAAHPVAVTLGEIMLRLSPPAGHRFGQTASFEATFGGAEANVAVALAHYGEASRFVTAVPDQAIGSAAVDALRAHGVDTTHVRRQGRRLGIYYLEHGASQRPSQVIYDRAGSAAAELKPNDIDWPAVMHGAKWFHWSGITPALSASAAETTLEALRAARAAGATISVDLNYRAKLWTADQARVVLTPMMEYVDVVIGNEEDAAKIWGIQAAHTDVAAGEVSAAPYEAVARELLTRFNLTLVAITLRGSVTASDNRWSACAYDGRGFWQSRSYAIRVVDRVGSGDAFAAGLIHSLLAGRDTIAALEFATAAACLKHSIAGDFNLVSAAEVEALVAGDATGRVRR